MKIAMKITIELTAVEVAGIKKYLYDTGGDLVFNYDVINHIRGIVDGVLHSPQEAVSDYIAEAEQTQKKQIR